MVVALASLALAPAALAQVAPGPEVERAGKDDPGGFRNVLPGGQGETVNLAEFIESEAPGGGPPDSFVDQLPLYNGLLAAAPSLRSAHLDRFFKPESFGVAEEEIDPEGTERPRPGVTILRDKTYEVPHVYGATRGDTMFGAGYASATDRLFLMDALRHAGRARLSELIGPGEDDENLKMDAEQLKIADYSERELQSMIDTTAADAGSEGERIKRDLLSYVDGINAYIREAKTTDPSKMPVEYAALGKPQGPEPWKPTDTVAVASLIGGIFGRGGGSEALASQALAAAQERFGGRKGRAVFEDFRREEDPEAPITTTKRFPFDDPGEGNRRAVAVPKLGSIRDRNPVESGSSATATSAQAAEPSGSLLEGIGGLPVPKRQSNALLIPGSESSSGQPLAVMGPQVGYFSPQILLELDLHGPGIDARGAAFPGISLYVLLGRGSEYAWSATTSTADNVDEFVEKLCEPDGSKPTRSSDHYRYNGRCRPFLTREHVIQTGTGAPPDSQPPRRVVLEVRRSVHGPIQGTAKVKGKPVAIAEARSTYMHELESARAFKRLNGNEVNGPRSFQRTMNFVNFAFNWFYAGRRDVSFFQSGWFPRRAPGTDPSLPTSGIGRYDWQGFEPRTFESRRMSFNELPKDTNPSRGYLVNWNNKQAPGWRSADDVFGQFGSVHRSERLEDRVRAGISGGRELSLTELTQIMELAATVDLRGQEVYPVLREVLGSRGGGEVRELVRILDSWEVDGSHRRDLDGDNVLDDSPAVALMDAWWPRLLKRMFRPRLGPELVDRIRDVNDFGFPPLPDGSSFFEGWYSYVDKDLRALVGDRVRQPLSRRYCGKGDLGRCRALLRKTLKKAADDARERYGVSDIQDARRPATCEEDPDQPRECDQIEFETAGAVETEPIHWQDRPTFQQIVEVKGGGRSPGRFRRDSSPFDGRR